MKTISTTVRVLLTPLLILGSLATLLWLIRFGLASALAYTLQRSLLPGSLSTGIQILAFLLLLAPLHFALQMIFRTGEEGRLGSAILALGFACLLLIDTLRFAPPRYFTSDQPHYYAHTPQGIYQSRRPGVDPHYGIPLKAITPAVAASLHLISKRSFFRADPAQSYWFHPNTGDPLLWYTPQSKGLPEFFSLPGYHPLTGATLQPITPDLYEKLHDQFRVLPSKASAFSVDAAESNSQQGKKRGAR